MPIKHEIWKVGSTPEQLPASRLVTERLLEDMIVATPGILSNEWMLIGRQERTDFNGVVDLLAIAPDGSLVLIELKRDRTPREIVAQSLDYASWVENLPADAISRIYARFSVGGVLSEAFRQRFGRDLEEDSLNQSHQIVIVASELDSSSERIVNYLNARDIAINVVCFRVFQCGEEQLLSRAWLIDPVETQANVATTTKSTEEREPWNGEFYVSFGGDCSWEEAIQYGFISAGGGSWFTRTLKLLKPNDRIWVKIPQVGYVGLGIVTAKSQTATDFMLPTPDGERPCLDVLKFGLQYKQRVDQNGDDAEHFVRVKWLDTRSKGQAVNEVGLFGNQNTVCQPTVPKWRHTIERLKTYFTNWNSSITAQTSGNKTIAAAQTVAAPANLAE
jgi:hypothetical protein